MFTNSLTNHTHTHTHTHTHIYIYYSIYIYIYVEMVDWGESDYKNKWKDG